jgi:hypothetical protein
MTYPDWHSEPDYKFTGELTYKGWAWEFLRRNPDYRSAYASFLDEAKAVELEYGADWRTNREARTYHPPKLEGESDQKWMKRCGFGLGLHPRRKWLDVLRGKPFRLAGMFDPHSVTANTVAFLDPDPFPLIAELPDDLDGYVEEFPVFDPESDQETGDGVFAFIPDVCVAVFDMTKSIKTQINEIRPLLSEVRKQRNIKGPHLPTIQPEWRRYLRVLDAVFDGVSNEDIAKVLWPVHGPDVDPVSRVMETRKQARRWTKKAKYSRLLLTENTQSG